MEAKRTEEINKELAAIEEKIREALSENEKQELNDAIANRPNVSTKEFEIRNYLENLLVVDKELKELIAEYSKCYNQKGYWHSEDLKKNLKNNK